MSIFQVIAVLILLTTVSVSSVADIVGMSEDADGDTDHMDGVSLQATVDTVSLPAVNLLLQQAKQQAKEIENTVIGVSTCLSKANSDGSSDHVTPQSCAQHVKSLQLLLLPLPSATGNSGLHVYNAEIATLKSQVALLQQQLSLLQPVSTSSSMDAFTQSHVISEANVKVDEVTGSTALFMTMGDSKEVTSPTWTSVWSNATPAIDKGETTTNTLFAASRILKRECTNCNADNTTIYYKRLTPIPQGWSIYANIIHVWASASNLLNTDFKLYGSWSDLINDTNAWQYCNYDDTKGVGGFRDCGPRGAGGQWNALSSSSVGQWSRTVTYYVLNASDTVPTPTPTPTATLSSASTTAPSKDDPKMVEIFKKAFTEAGLTNCSDKTKCWCPPGDICYGGTYSGGGDRGAPFMKHFLSAGITSFPKGVFRGLTINRPGILPLNGNMITSLPNGLFTGLTLNDAVVYLDSNKITEIVPGAFDGMTINCDGTQDDGYVWILDNQITSIEPETFRGLTIDRKNGVNCGYINLTANKVSYIAKGWSNGVTIKNSGSTNFIVSFSMTSNPGKTPWSIGLASTCQSVPGDNIDQRHLDSVNWNHPECLTYFNNVKKISVLEGISYTTTCDYIKATDKCGLSLTYSSDGKKTIVSKIDTLSRDLKNAASSWVKVDLSNNKIGGSLQASDDSFFKDLSTCNLSENSGICSFSSKVAEMCQIKLCDKDSTEISATMTPMRFVCGAGGSTVTFSGTGIRAGDVVAVLPADKLCRDMSEYKKQSLSDNMTVSWQVINEPGSYRICIQNATNTSKFSELKNTVTVIATPSLGHSTVSKDTGQTDSIVVVESTLSTGDLVIITTSTCSDVRSDLKRLSLSKGNSGKYSAALPVGMFSLYRSYNVCFTTKETGGQKGVDYVIISDSFFLTRRFEQKCEDEFLEVELDRVKRMSLYDLRSVVSLGACADPPIANQGACGNCYAWAAASMVSLTQCVQSKGQIPMDETMSAPMLSRCLTGCGGAHMDRTFDQIAGAGTFACINEKNKDACSTGCIPDNSKFYYQRQLDPMLCPSYCETPKFETKVVGRRSSWCGILAKDDITRKCKGKDCPDDLEESLSLINTGTDNVKIRNAINIAKMHLSSNTAPSAMAVTLLLYIDAIKTLHDDCSASKCKNWKNKIILLKPRTESDRAFCKTLRESEDTYNTFKTKYAGDFKIHCDCWSILLGNVAPYWLLDQCGMYPAAHVVQLIGWGEASEKSENGTPVTTKYWTLQNQWGSGWGDNGFFKLEQGVNLWGIEDEMYVIKPQNASTRYSASSTESQSLTALSEEASARHRRPVRRLVGGWVQAHHQSSSLAQAALQHLGDEFIGQSPAVTAEEHTRTCTSHMSMLHGTDDAMTYKRHRIIKVESAEMQVVAGVNHRFHVMSQDVTGSGGRYHRHRVTVHRRIDGSHALLHVEHVEELNKESI